MDCTKKFMPILIGVCVLLPFLSKSQTIIKRYYDKDSTQLMAEFMIDTVSQQPDGVFKLFAKDGTLREHRIFKGGLLWETIFLTDSSGNVMEDLGTLKNGTGTVKNYDGLGRLQSLRTQKNGLLHGESVKYYDNGGVAMRGNYFEGSRCGTWYRYDKSGKVQPDGVKHYGIDCRTGEPVPHTGE